MAHPPVREPETTWGFIRAVIQAGTGVAFVLEEMPRIGVFLFVVAACTVVYETVQWRRARRRRRASEVATAPPVDRRARAAGRPTNAGRTMTPAGR